MLNKAYIDLNKLRKNALEIKKKLDKNTKFCAVVKADAYGHGAEKISSTLYPYCDCFAVALVEEGVALRLSGIKKDILVLIPPFFCDIERAVFYNLTLSASDLDLLKKIESVCKNQDRKAKIHLKFNVGMNRLGVDSLKQLNVLAKFVASSNYLILDGMFSHVGDFTNKKALNLIQNKFLLANKLIKGYNNKAICHISASGGYLAGMKSDMARIGILLYGYKPFASDFISVSPIMKIYAPLISWRKVEKGQNCLYGSLTAEKNLEVGLVRVGYADGVMRQNIAGQFNNRCMDITALTNPKITKNGVLIMDNADLLASQYHTISYEILTKSAIRAEKIYLN
jgi:alanine racemase